MNEEENNLIELVEQENPIENQKIDTIMYLNVLIVALLFVIAIKR